MITVCDKYLYTHYNSIALRIGGYFSFFFSNTYSNKKKVRLLSFLLLLHFFSSFLFFLIILYYIILRNFVDIRHNYECFICIRVWNKGIFLFFPSPPYYYIIIYTFALGSHTLRLSEKKKKKNSISNTNK